MYKIGLSFIDSDYKTKTINDSVGSGDKSFYSVKESRELYTNDDIKQLLDLQEKYKLKIEQQKQRDIDEQRKLKELVELTKEHYKYLNAYFNNNNFTELQKGKIKKCLNTTQLYNRQNVLSRLEFVQNTILSDATAGIRKETNHKTNNTKNVYCINYNDSEYIIITKTEYNFALWLENNK